MGLWNVLNVLTQQNVQKTVISVMDTIDAWKWITSKFYWAFLEKNCNPPVKDINRKLPGGRVKVVGIPGGTPKVEEKTWILKGKGGNAKGR